jgi:hypothetical protein
VLLWAACATGAMPGWAAGLQFGGEYRVRAFDVDNFSDARSEGGCGTPAGSCDDQERFLDQRFRLTTTVTAGVTAGVVTVDLLNNFAGSRPPNSLTGVGGGNTGDNRFGTSGLGGSINGVGLREAFLKIALPRATVYAGRHHIVLGHSIIFDDMADGFTVAVPVRFAQTLVSLSALKLAEADAGLFAGPASDTDLYLGHTQLQPDPAHAFSFYAGALRDRGPTMLNGLIYGLVDENGVPQVTTPDLSPATGTVFLVGLTYDGRVGPSTFAFEFDALRGFIDSVPFDVGGPQTVPLIGFDLLASQHLDLGPVTVGLTMVYASGSGADDFGEVGGVETGANLTDISPNFVLGNILGNGEHVSDRDGSTLNMGGFQGGLNQGGAGLFAIKVSLAGEPRPGVTLEGAVIYAKTVDPVIPDINPASPSYCPIDVPGVPPVPGVPSCKADDRIGWELDLNAAWQVDQHLELAAGVGYLIGDNAFSGLYNNDFTSYDTDPITKLFWKAIFRF